MLRQGFWLKSWATILQSPAMHFCNGDIREEFEAYESYINPLRVCPQPSFRGAMDCYEGHMVLLRPEHEEFFKPVWSARALSKPNFVITNPHVCKIQVE